MKKFLLACMIASASVFNPLAMAASVDVDAQLAKATYSQPKDENAATTAATGAQLTSVRWNFDGYTLLADLSSKDVGAEWTECPGFKLGMTGGASTEKKDGKEKHDSKVTVYAKTAMEFGAGKIDNTLRLTRHQAVGSMDSESATYALKYFFSRGQIATPYAGADVTYTASVPGDDSKWSGSLSFGVRASIK